MSDQHAGSLRATLLVARYEIAAMLSSVRALLFVVAYGVTVGSVGAFVLFVDQKSEGKIFGIEAAAATIGSTERQAMIAELTSQGVPSAVAEAFLSGQLPLLVLLILFFSTFVVPALVLLVGYSGISEDLRSGFSRFVLQRVRREHWLAGKVLALFAVSYGAVIVVHGALIALASGQPNFDVARVSAALPRVFAGMAVFLLGYVSFTAVFSVLVQPPFAAFALGLIALAVLWVLSLGGPLSHVWMGAAHMELWALDPRAIGIYLGHAAVFLGIAWLALERRDV